jgi:hypothetical protein
VKKNVAGAFATARARLAADPGSAKRLPTASLWRKG